MTEPIAITYGRVTEAHRAHLRTSGLTDETIELAGIYSLRESKDVAEALGYKRWKTGGGAIAFPVYRRLGTGPVMVRVRPDNPRERKGQPVKYDQPKGSEAIVYFPPRTLRERLQDDGPIIITEGEKKALLLDQLGYCAIGLIGTSAGGDKVKRIAGQGRHLHAWMREDVRFAGRLVVICFDSDVATKTSIQRDEAVLAGMLLASKSREVRCCRIGHAVNGNKRGIDDLYVEKGGGEAGAKAVAAAIERAEPLTAAAEVRPEIVVTTEERQVNDAACAALAADELIYQRGRRLVHVVTARAAQQTELEPEAPAIVAMPKSIVRERMAATAAWVAVDAEGELRRTHPPKWSVEAVHDRGQWDGVRPLTGVVEQPTLRPDGSLITKPGYDEPTGLLYLDGGIAYPKIPERPTLADAQRALTDLQDVVCDFDFAAPHHRAAWLALVLTLSTRYAIEGPVPLALVDAPVAGAGKGLLADIACRIGTGRAAPLDGLPATDDEMDKRMLAWALGGRSVVSLDNVQKLGGDSLCRMLTARVVGGRVLGATAEANAPLRITPIATGNNVQLGADMHRRVLHIRLAPRVEDPSERTGFRHTDLVAHVMRHRPRLVAAALTVLLGYVVAGRPAQDLPAWGSYEAWSALVRAALVWAGQPDPAAGRKELRAQADDRHELHRALVIAWRKLVANERGPITVARAIELAKERPERVPGLEGVMCELATDRRGELSSRALGYVLRQLRGRVFCDGGASMMIDTLSGAKRPAPWTVQTTDDGGDSGDVPNYARRDSGLNFNPEVVRGEREVSPPSPPSPPPDEPEMWL